MLAPCHWPRLALGGCLLLCLATSAPAQRVLYPTSPASRPQQLPYPVNRNQYILPNTTARQLYFSTRAIGRAAGNLAAAFRGVYAGGVAPLYGGYGYGGYGYGGYCYYENPYAASLQGMASLTQATGQYW